MRELLLKIEWALAKLLDRVVGALERRLEPEPKWDTNPYSFTVHASDPFWHDTKDGRVLHLGEGFGLVFERKEDQ